MPEKGSANHNRLLDAPVGKTLIELAGPMVVGLAAIVLFNLVDTFYVGRLGARELAAMGFTFSVVFVVMSIAMGLGMGVTSAISRAIGEGDRNRVCRLATDGLFLANTVVVIVALVGLFTIRPLFGLLGASPEMVDLISKYMTPWYVGVGFLVIPMVGNSAIRATGDTKTPSFVMIIAGVVNVILDPLLIFGLGPFPRLELQGAAVATVISWTVTFAAALWILTRREKMIDFSVPRFKLVLQSWRSILYVGVPAVVTNAMIPLAMGIITRMVSAFGTDAVAAYGVGIRIQTLSVIGISALAAAMTPFVGQNFGARNCPRVRAAVGFGMRSSLLYGIVAAIVLAILARPLAGVFNDNLSVRATTALYLWILPISYGSYGVGLVMNSVFNAVNRPMKSAFLTLFRVFLLAIPLAYVGSLVRGVPGIFVGVSIANILSGLVALVMVRGFIVGAEREMEAYVKSSPDATAIKPASPSM